MNEQAKSVLGKIADGIGSAFETIVVDTSKKTLHLLGFVGKKALLGFLYLVGFAMVFTSPLLAVAMVGGLFFRKNIKEEFVKYQNNYNIKQKNRSVHKKISKDIIDAKTYESPINKKSNIMKIWKEKELPNGCLEGEFDKNTGVLATDIPEGLKITNQNINDIAIYCTIKGKQTVFICPAGQELPLPSELVNDEITGREFINKIKKFSYVILPCDCLTGNEIVFNREKERVPLRENISERQLQGIKNENEYDKELSKIKNQKKEHITINDR